MKKVLLSILAVVSVVALAITGTVAYLQSEDEDVNVMTLGNVKIEQVEYERDENGNLVDFTQAKPAYPAVGTIAWADEGVEVNGVEYKVFSEDLKNVVDKIVTVNNTGKSDAYLRTLVAIEAPEGDPNDLIHVNHNIIGVTLEPAFLVDIDGVTYYVMSFVYNEALAAGAKSAPSLMQVFLDAKTTNEDCAKFGDVWDIKVISQAVQTNGFDDAATALNTAFGVPAEKAAEWFGALEVPVVFSWEGVNYITEGDTTTVSSAGGNTVYRGIVSEGITTSTNVVVEEGITRLNNRALCKAPMLTSVELPNSLTYIDEGVFQQSGFVAIEIPENVTYIGKQAFGACGSLETIVINAKDVTIANYVARACVNLKEVYINSDSVTFESGSMYFTNKENADASGITFYVKNSAIADTLYNAFSTSHSYGLLIKNVDGTEYYNTLK